MTRPVTVEGGIEELRQRVTAGHHNYAIALGGGIAISRKTIRFGPGGGWTVVNHIDDTTQVLSGPELWQQSHIGLALDNHALGDMDGNDGLLNVAGRGWVPAGPVLEEERARAAEWREAHAKERADNPLRFTLDMAPGAIRMGEDADVDWEPANPALVLESCDIGPATVAQIDLAATCMGFMDEGCPHAATTSIELTIEDIDEMIATLTALREDATTNRGFALRASGFWTNGIDEEE